MHHIIYSKSKVNDDQDDYFTGKNESESSCYFFYTCLMYSRLVGVSTYLIDTHWWDKILNSVSNKLALINAT